MDFNGMIPKDRILKYIVNDTVLKVIHQYRPKLLQLYINGAAVTKIVPLLLLLLCSAHLLLKGMKISTLRLCALCSYLYP